MANLRVEVCMISARGLRRSSSLWKLHWFAVGWVDPKSKYCSRIDSSGSSNPTWNTKFSASIDNTKVKPHDLVLTIEVYSREPVFLREKLHGTATVQLKEFLGKFANGSADSRSGTEEVGSFQLRRKKAGKPRGFVDVSIRVCEGTDSDKESPGNAREEFGNWDRRSGISLAIDDGSVVAYPSHPWPTHGGGYSDHAAASYPYHREPPGYPQNRQLPGYPHTQQMPPLAGNRNVPSAPGAAEIRRQGTPPPPPPPSNTGFIPSFFPGIGRPPESYVGIPSAGRAAPGSTPGFGAGLGAGALAAGAVIFGDDFLSGSDFPAGFGGGSLTVSTDTPF